MSRYLLDTSVLILLLREQVLPRPIVELLNDSSHEVHYSALSVAELSIKYAIGKLPLPPPVVEDPAGQIAAAAEAGRIEQLPLRLEHAVVLMTLPLIHRDPFDRLLVAQALQEGMIFVTSDRVLPRYPDLTLLRF